MPLINRFRIVNFRFDDDRKYIANETFDFLGANSLLNLENGGGKSVILQLALQVIIPNAQLGSRKFSDYFKLNSGTVHIMTEWTLGALKSEYLLTGICASRDTEGLRFFTYTHVYTCANDNDIRHIPAVNEKRQVAGYSEFYQYLRGLSSSQGYRINVYSRDRQKEYRQKLNTYNLFEDEFEAIRIINQSEGGMEKFFENAKKSRNVIEKLIIPSIPRAAGDEAGLLAETFKKHVDNLKSIPVYQHNIELYDSFCRKADELLLKIEDYGMKAEENISKRRELLILDNMLAIVLNRLDGDAERLKREEEEIRGKIRNVRYRKDSYEYYLKMDEIAGKQSGLDEMRVRLAQWRDRCTEIDSTIKFRLSMNDCMELRECRNRLVEQKTRLDAMTGEKEELEEEYQNCLLFLRNMLAGDCEKMENTLEKLRKDRNENSLLIDRVKQSIKEADTRRDGIRDEIAATGSRLGLDEEELAGLSRYFLKDITLTLDPEESLKKFEDTDRTLKAECDTASAELEKTQNALEDNRINESELRQKRAELEERRKNIEDEAVLYDERNIALKNEISMYSIDGDAYRGNTCEKLRILKDKTTASLTSNVNKYYELEKKKLVLNGCNYYIPDYEIRKLYEFLRDNGISCIPGSLWLKYQPEEKRSGLIHLNPLLQYSVVVEEAETGKVAALAADMAKLVGEYPAALVVNNMNGIKMEAENAQTDAGLKETDAGLEEMPANEKRTDGICRNTLKKGILDFAGGIDRVADAEVYVIYAQNNRFIVSESEFSAYMEQMEANLSALRSGIDVLRQDEDKIADLISRVSEFASVYPADYRQKVSDRLDTVKGETARSESRLTKCAKERDALVKELGDIRDRMARIESNAAENRSDIQNMQLYIEISARNARHRQTMENAKKIELQVENDRIKLVQEHDKLLENRKELEKKADSASNTLEKTVKKLASVKASLKINCFTRIIEADPINIEAKVEGLRSELLKGDTGLIVGNIELLQKNAEGYEKSIRKRGHRESDFDGFNERTPDYAIQESEDELAKLERGLKLAEAEERETEGDIKGLTGEAGSICSSIMKTYGIKPYAFDQVAAIDPGSFDMQLEEYERKLVRLSGKISEYSGRSAGIGIIAAELRTFIQLNHIEMPPDRRIDFNESGGLQNGETLWDMLKMPVGKLAVLKNECTWEYESNERILKDSEETVKRHYDELHGNLEWADNSTIRQILSNIMGESIFNYEYIKSMFNNVFASVENMKRATVLQLEECLRNKAEIVERCYRRGESIYEEIKMVDSFSKIKLGNTNRKTIDIDMPVLEPERGKAMMARYVESCIDEIGKLKEKGNYDPARIDDEIALMMSPVRLLDAIASLNEIVIKVYKPESNMDVSRYISWETVINWSGGEKLAGFFAMFISIVSYLRYKRTNWNGSPKVIWIDNPFGQANAVYLLTYIFELAKATGTQMICLTGLQEVNIYAQFNVVYSLVHRTMPLSNVSVIRSRLVKSETGMESAFFNVGHEQMSLL